MIIFITRLLQQIGFYKRTKHPDKKNNPQTDPDFPV